MKIVYVVRIPEFALKYGLKVLATILQYNLIIIVAFVPTSLQGSTVVLDLFSFNNTAPL